MKKDLYVCNTVYQILVAMWIKYTYYPNDLADIIISDHMNDGEAICKRMQDVQLFNQCYYCTTKGYCYGGYYKEIANPKTSLMIRRHPDKYVKKYFDSDLKYNRIFIANVDRFAQVLYDACCRKKRSNELYLFEDGIGTYSRLFESYYISTRPDEVDLVHRIIYKCMNKKYIYGNIKGCYLFNPNLFDWDSDFSLLNLLKIDINDLNFKSMCNTVFDYSQTDKYDTKYIFMEESYYAEGFQVNDIEIMDKVSSVIGKENITVKIHPRNPVNRFKEKGYVTNHNTSIPWEVIVMNRPDILNKTLLTIASSSVLNPFLIFGLKVKAISLYPLIEKNTLKNTHIGGDLWSLTKDIFYKNPDLYTFLVDVSALNTI